MQPNNPWQPNNQTGQQPPQPAQPYAQPPYPQQAVPQPGPNGQYAVVPPPQIGGNNGHTGHNPYEFIVNPNTPSKRQQFGSSNAFLWRIALIVGGAALLMILAAVVLSMLGPKDNKALLTAIAQQQAEIVRIADDASEKAVNQSTQNFVSTVNISVASDQAQVTGYLADTGTKLSKKTLALGQDPKTDTLLDSAATSDTYDSTLIKVLTTELQDYQKQLQTAYNSATKGSKPVLQQAYQSVGTLLKQAQSLSQ